MADGTKEDLTSSLQKLNNILVKVDEVLEMQNSSLISSCQDIINKQPDSLSGYYHIGSELVYCEMGELCNSTGGGWTRLGYFDMTDSTVDCPPGFNLIEAGGVRACGRSSDCTSVKLPSNGISYSEVCGRVVGYQYGSPDAVSTAFSTIEVHNDINANYVDGVSITQGFPRKHVWTMMAGYSENYSLTSNCPCNTIPGASQQVQSFVGNDYFCESGNPNSNWILALYTADPLWDGEGCGSQEGNCCAADGLPWFHKTFNSTTTDYIELRLCGDQVIADEDVPISFYEIYVK